MGVLASAPATGVVDIAAHVVLQMSPDLEAHGCRLAHCLAGLGDQTDKLHMPQLLEAPVAWPNMTEFW